ncbi:hypothetical protein EXIGLDRAFT_729871 [Exidia glandulosa HHB12029]|uniref:Zinc finger GRF-type domain-containing protein n=1 Tax=Exidia glandulosa HHB12029 TaxID=1314781 RepID=A0A165LEH4_EXIGL|nr:hypothetical protein EXIGLDRAFT_729871 [Exidia glandulosa HHB12029]
MSQTPRQFDDEGFNLCTCGIRAQRRVASDTSTQPGVFYYKCPNPHCPKQSPPTRGWLFWEDTAVDLRRMHNVRDPYTTEQAGPSSSVPLPPPTVAPAPRTVTPPTRSGSQPSATRPLRAYHTEPVTTIQRQFSKLTTDATSAVPAPVPTSPAEVLEVDTESDLVEVHATDDEYQSISRVSVQRTPQGPESTLRARAHSHSSASGRKKARMPGTFASSSGSSSSAQDRIEAWRATSTIPPSRTATVVEEDTISTAPRDDGPPTGSSSRTETGTETETGSTASRMYRLRSSVADSSSASASVTTVRLSEPSTVSNGFDLVAKELKRLKKQMAALERENAVKTAEVEQLKREKIALHDKCAALEDSEAALQEAFRAFRRRARSEQGN